MQLLRVLAVTSLAFSLAGTASASITVQAGTAVRAKPAYIGASMIEYHDVPSPIVTNSPIDFQQDLRDDKCKMIRMGSYPSPRNSAETLANFDAKVQAILAGDAVPLFYAPIKPGVANYFKLDGTLGGTPATNVAYLVNHYKAAPFNLTTQYWEVGNEPDLNVDYLVGSVQEYLDVFTAVHNALTTAGTRGNVKLCGPVTARTYHQGVTNGFNDQLIDQFLVTCKDMVDVVTVHTYQNMSATVTADNLLNNPSKADNEFNATRTINPTDFNYQSPTANMGLGGIAAKMQSLGITFARNPGLGITEHNATELHSIYAGLWNLQATQWFNYNGGSFPTVLDNTFIYDQKGTAYGVGIYNADGTYDPSHWAIWINGNLRGSTILQRSVTGNLNSYGNTSLLVCASKDAGSLYVEVLNRSAAAITDSVAISGATVAPNPTIYTLSATATPDNGVASTLGTTFNYAFPAYSATIFKFSLGGPPLANLALWLKGDAGVTANGSGFISAWADQSGNGRNGTQSTSSSQPSYQLSALNGKPSIYFDGNDTLTLASGVTSAGYHVFAVVKPDSGLAGAATIVSGGAGSFQYRLETDAKQRVNKAQTLALGTSTTALSSSTYSRASASYASPTLKFWRNGAADGTASAAATFSAAVSSVGSRVGAEFFKGSIAEILLYTGPLSETDRQAVEAYLAAKYNL